MSESSRLRAYRACVNLPEAANGRVLLIDDSDDRWADRIRSGMLTPVGPPPDYVEPEAPITRNTFLPAALVDWATAEAADLPTIDAADVLADAGLDAPAVDE